MQSALKYVNYSLSAGLFVWILLGLFTVEVSGYSEGANTSLCGDMDPSDANVDRQDNTNSPYSIEFVSSVSYYSTDPIRIRIQGPDYEGILLQVRNNDTMDETALGTFSVSEFLANTQGINCSTENDTVTHLNTTPKTNETIYTWNPPNDLMYTIIFVATVWQNETIFYVQLKSTPLDRQPDSNSISPTSTSDDTMSTNDMEEMSSSDDDNDMMTTSQGDEDTTSTAMDEDHTASTAMDDDDTTSTATNYDDTTSTAMDEDHTASTAMDEDDTTSTATNYDDTTSTAMDDGVASSTTDDDMASSAMDDDMMASSEANDMASTSDAAVEASSTMDNDMASSTMDTGMATTSAMENTAQINPSSTDNVPEASAGVNETTSTTTTTAATTTQPPMANVSSPVSFSINDTFDSDLTNTSSAKYTAKRDLIINQMEPTFRTIEGFVEIKEVTFKNGSIVVNFNVVYSVVVSTDAPTIASNLQTQITNAITTAVNNGTVNIPGLQVDTLQVMVPVTCPENTIIIQTSNGGECQQEENSGSVGLHGLKSVVALLPTFVAFVFYHY